MLLKKKKKKKKKKKTGQNFFGWIRTLSVNLQWSRSSDYAITTMVQWLNLLVFSFFVVYKVYLL